jgi:hypothetical protein
MLACHGGPGVICLWGVRMSGKALAKLINAIHRLNIADFSPYDFNFPFHGTTKRKHEGKIKELSSAGGSTL